MVVFNKTVVALALVGYKMIISQLSISRIILYPTRARGVFVLVCIILLICTILSRQWELI